MNLPHAEERCEAPRLEARTLPLQSELALTGLGATVWGVKGVRYMTDCTHS